MTNPKNHLTKQFKELIETIGEDTKREGLLKTPERAAKAMLELTKGYTEDLNGIINDAVFTSNSDQMVLIQNIEFYSLCEHHLLPFTGKCHIAYIPNGKVLGLSKFARIVDHFSRRLQIQESLTQQIADAVNDAIQPLGVGVVIESQHFCMMMRGVEKQHPQMKTSVMLGSFREDSATRGEFLSLLRL